MGNALRWSGSRCPSSIFTHRRCKKSWLYFQFQYWLYQ